MVTYRVHVLFSLLITIWALFLGYCGRYTAVFHIHYLCATRKENKGKKGILRTPWHNTESGQCLTARNCHRQVFHRGNITKDDELIDGIITEIGVFEKGASGAFDLTAAMEAHNEGVKPTSVGGL